jgi:NAD(P)-dependent dehydrogenase (short-subunit alcohol dehydrogenase family)
MEGKVALVTGSAGGIGAACARELAAAGAALMLTDIDEARCQLVSDALNAEGGKTLCAHHDVTDEAAWQNVIATTLSGLGGLDALVNNAGMYTGGTLISNTLEQLRKVQQVNVDSIFLGMKYAAEAMKPEGAAGRGGSIINLSSVAGLIGVPGHTAYGSTKGAVRLYTKHAAVEFARLGYDIRVNSIHPGLIETDMGQLVFEDFVEIGMAENLEEAQETAVGMIPMARLGTAEEVAKMTRFLASDDASYVTGAEFVVDGGMTAT